MAGAWYYTEGEEQKGPVSLEELREAARSGRLAADAMVWGEGLEQWRPAREVEELGYAGPGPAASGEASAQGVLSYQAPAMEPVLATANALEMLRQTRPWARLFAVLLFITAALALVGGCIFGLATAAVGQPAAMLVLVLYVAMALLYVIPAVYLNRYALRIDDLLTLRRSVDLEAALEAQKSFWKFIGILTSIAIGIWALGMAIAILAAVTSR